MQSASSVTRSRFAYATVTILATAGCGDIARNGLLDVPDARGAGDRATASGHCDVTFTVVVDVDGNGDGDGDRPLLVTGNAIALGAWDPRQAVSMSEVHSAVWSARVQLANAARVEFKFVRRGGSGDAEWESWGPASNRTLDVRCVEDGASATGAGGPAVGTQYEGHFGIRPPDATATP